MNHINWVQQDPDYQTKYHVLKWKSSHFHEPTARQMVNSALHKEGAAFAVSAGQEQAGMPEIGLGPASTVKSGGFGLGHGQELAMQQTGTPQRGKQHQREESGSVSERIITAAVGQGTIRNRLKESAARLQEIYEKQKQKLKRTLFRVKRAEKKPEPQKKPGRKADREETLSMRAQNHYLLDSYDRNGQYHTLGK